MFRFVVIATMFAVSSITAPVLAGDPDDKPAGIIAASTTLKATVDAIDYDKRTVVLRSEDGQETTTLEVGPEVKNFAQVKKGDVLVVEQVESVALVVVPKGEAPSAKGGTSYVEVAKLGEKPRRVEVHTREIVATVDAIDYKARTVTLRGPEGNSRTLKVGPEAKRFDNVKKGDEVYVSYTETTAISVQAPPKK
ncbi:MAG: hypothetical protein ACOYXU_09250 [Nitrospirota bacterium]